MAGQYSSASSSNKVSFMSANEPFSECTELVVQPPASRSCRFWQKNLKCQGKKVPCISLFYFNTSTVKNKDLVEFLGVNSLVLANLTSLLGLELRKDSKLSNVSCFTWASIHDFTPSILCCTLIQTFIYSNGCRNYSKCVEPLKFIFHCR